MELSALRAPRPVMPRLAPGDKRVQSILRDLDKIKHSKPVKRLKRAEFLINYITQSLRKCADDHLLHTTSIWALITIFRLFPEATKETMIAAGVPGCLFEILKSGTLTGSSRQYASELCFYLSSNYSHPGEVWDGGPMDLPEVQVANRYQPDLDDVSIMSDVSSVVNEKKSRHPFVPYRINEVNLAKMEAMFEQGYHKQVAASLPNTLLLSKYGFETHGEETKSHKNDDDSDESDVDEQEDADDKSTDVSTLSSASRSRSHSVLGSNASISSRLQKESRSMRFPIQDDEISASSAGSSRSNSYQRNIFAGDQARRPTTTALYYGNTPFRMGQNRRHDDFEDGNGSELFLPPRNSHSATDFLLSQSQTLTASSVMISSTPHRMIQQLREQQQFQQLQPQQAMREEGVFSAWTTPNRPFKTVTRNERQSIQARYSKSFFSTEKEQPAVDVADIDAYYSSLDPLAVSIKSAIKHSLSKEAKGVAEDVDDDGLGGWIFSSDDEDDDKDNHRSGMGKMRKGTALDDDDYDEGEEEEEDVNNEFVVQRRLRMRAEKLIDHSFVQKLFIKKATMRDGQDLVHRMESLLELLDPEKTGYVTFESFTRLILAVAPPHIVRGDVLNFMNAQTKRMGDLVDYNEFIISGKVLLLTKAQRAEQLRNHSRSAYLPKGAREAFAYRSETASTMTWLKRQKQFVGNESTYTWKNHLKWYQRRKAQAVIWLIRRATRSLKHEIILDAAKKWLLTKSKHALAMNWLMGIGHAALLTEAKGAIAKRRLMKRVMHARRFMLKVIEAREYLVGTALTAIKDLEYMDRVMALKATQQLQQQQELISAEEARKALEKKRQANYAAFFKVASLQRLATTALQQRAKRALKHGVSQDEALDWIRRLVRRTQGQMILQDRARRRLMQRAEAAYAFCLQQDQSLLGLLRVGDKALKHFDRQTAALSWLLQRGVDALAFLANRFSTAGWLYEKGRQTLFIMNRREDAFAYLNHRRLKSMAFLIRRQEAMVFLRAKPHNIWKIIDNTLAAQAWLEKRALRARKHHLQHLKAAQYLQHIAGKATTTARRAFIAYQELAQIGMAAKLTSFKLVVANSLKLLKLVATDKERNLKTDAKAIQTRQLLPDDVRLRVEFAEAFQILTSVYTPSHMAAKKPLKHLDAISSKKVPAFDAAMEEEHQFIGLFAFRILVGQGKLLRVPLAAVDEFFRNTDVNRSGYLTFDHVFPWIKRRASRIENFKFKVSDLLSAEERAFISIWLRVQRDSEFIQTASAYNEYDEARKRQQLRNKQLMDASDDEDEDDGNSEEDEEIDEDILFSDIERLRNMDVGRLMRYLTRQREAKLQQQQQMKMKGTSTLDASPTIDPEKTNHHLEGEAEANMEPAVEDEEKPRDEELTGPALVPDEAIIANDG